MIPLLVQPISNKESTNILPVPWIRFHRCRFHGIDRLANREANSVSDIDSGQCAMRFDDYYRWSIYRAARSGAVPVVLGARGLFRGPRLRWRAFSRVAEPALRTFVFVNPQSGAEDATRRRMQTKERHNDYKTSHPRRLCRNGFGRWCRTRRSPQHRR